MELGCSGELHPNGVGPQEKADIVGVKDGSTKTNSPQQTSLTPTSQKPIKIGENVGVKDKFTPTNDWLADLFVRVKEIPPKAWIDIVETHGRLYARWKSKIPAPTTGKKSLYIAPLNPIRTENKLDDKAREALQAKRKRSTK